MNKRMKYGALALTAAVLLPLCGCNSYDECPPLNEGYATTYLMPEGIYLSDEDWEAVEALEQEYEDFLAAQKQEAAAAKNL